MELFNEPIIERKTLSEVIKNDNVITNTSIVGGSFNGGKITIGSGENIFTANKDGIFLGSSSFDTAPFSVNMLGDVIANSIIITGGSLDGTTTIGGRLCSTVAEAIDANGHFIDDRFDTDSKTILSDFTFGTSGALQIGTYSDGVSGDIRISPNGILGRNKDGDTTFSINGTTGDATFGGTLVAASGTFGTVTAGTLSGVEISGSTITGGTIQTATSGKRIRMVSGAATTPNQNANSIALIDSDNIAIINIGTEDSLLMSIRPEDDDVGLVVQAKDTLTYTKSLLSSSILDSDSTGIAGYFENNGTGDVVQIQADSTGIGLHITTAGATSSSTDVVRIDSAKNGDSLKINKSTNYGRGLYINTTGTTNIYQPLYITNSGYGGSQITQSNDSSSALSALLLEQYNGIKPPLHLTNIAVSTYFRRMIWLGSLTIWKSDGVTPNGNLSGSIGDICFGADSGKAYYCTGTTNWTSL